MWTLIGKILLSAVIIYAAYQLFENLHIGYGPIGIVLTSFFWPRLFSRDIIELMLLLKYFGEKSAVFHLHGRYYNFDGRQIRFFLVGELVWIPLDDLKKILEPEINERELRLLGSNFGTIPDEKLQGVTEEGLMQLLKIRTEHRLANYSMIRFKRWLLRSAFQNVKRLPKSAINN